MHPHDPVATIPGKKLVDMQAATLESWHDFYLTIGTASASLIGLLFVALSINLDVVTAEGREELRVFAEQAFNSFTITLLMSVVFLVPEDGASIIGISYVFLAAGAGFRLLRRGPAVWRGRKRGGMGEAIFWRFGLPAAAAIGLLASGVALMMDQPNALYWLVPVVLVLLLSAARSSWDLLVEAGQIRRSETDTRATGGATAGAAALSEPEGSAPERSTREGAEPG